MSENNPLDLSEFVSDTPILADVKSSNTGKWLLPVLIVAGLAAVAGVYYLSTLSKGTTGDEPSRGVTAEVKRGPMIVSISGSNSQVDVAKRTVIRNELDWPAIIAEIVPDGTEVSEGDLVIKFECTKLEDALENADISVEKSKLAHQQAAENLKLKRKEMDNKVRKAEQTVADAKADLAKYLDDNGEWETILDKAESDITLAKEELVLAEGRLNFKIKVNTDPELNKPYSESEIKGDTLGVERLKKKVKEAESALYLLKTYDYPRQVRTRKDGVVDANLELERTKLIATTQIRLAQAALDTQKTLLEKAKEKLAEYKEDTEQRVTIRATGKGRVVYHTGYYRSRNSSEVEVGEEIAPRQQLMIIPDMSTLEIHTKVMETLVNDLVAGKTKVLVGIRAWPGLGKLPAVLKWRAPQADQQSRWRSSGTKMYSAIIELENRNIPGVWPGMNAEVEMIIRELDDVLSVPIAAVFSEQEKSFCWRVNGSATPERVEVAVGATNEQSAEIKSGLKEGDRVMLIAPQTSGKENGGGGVTRSANGKKPEKSAGGAKSSAKSGGAPAGARKPNRGKKPGTKSGTRSPGKRKTGK
ncbi:MAG: hypothetical protein GY794_02205 [bacterium]|nr:hypothetical protein [bacterium]